MAIKPITNKHLVSKESVNRANEASTKSLENRPNVSRSENAAQSFTPGADFTKNYSVTLEDVDTSKERGSIDFSGFKNAIKTISKHIKNDALLMHFECFYAFPMFFDAFLLHI